MNSTPLSRLFFLCRCLTPYGDASHVEELRREIGEGEVPWEHVIQLANESLVIANLFTALAAKGLLDVLPEDVREYLTEIHRLNRMRNSAIRRQAEEIIRELNRAGIEPILLKGVAQLFTDRATDPGARIMRDIDILVGAEDVATASAKLAEQGYEPQEADHPAIQGLQHLPPLCREGQAAPVEVHHRLFHEVSDPEVLEPQDVWSQCREASHGDLRFRLLSPSHRVIHIVGHSEVHHHAFARGVINIRELLDLAALRFGSPEQPDWSEICNHMRQRDLLGVIGSFMFMASRLFLVPIPQELGARIGTGLHYLRCVALLNWGGFKNLDAICSAPFKLADLLSARTLKERFGCSDHFADLTRLRLQYTGYLVRTYLLGARRELLMDRLLGKESKGRDEESDGHE